MVAAWDSRSSIWIRCAITRVYGVRSPLATFGVRLKPDPAKILKLDLRSELDDLIRRQPEERHGARRVARHEGEELLPPDRHPERSPGDECFATEEEGRTHHVDWFSPDLESGERLGHVGVLHVSEMQRDPVETLPEILELRSFAPRNEGHRIRHDREENDPLVHGLVVDQVLEEGRRSARADAVHEDRSPRHPQ